MGLFIRGGGGSGVHGKQVGVGLFYFMLAIQFCFSSR
jgi:hypothetical protein